LRSAGVKDNPDASMPRFRLLIEYAGTRYSGWQIQKNARTVQGEIDRAVRLVAGPRAFELYGSGRTDAGVHALAQVAHLDLYTTLAPELLHRRLNDELPADIHVRAVARAPHRFHARHDARLRSYLYQISRRRTAFGKPYVWWIKDPLDVDRMRRGAAVFHGLRDFAAFTDDDPGEKSTRVQLAPIEIAEAGSLVLLRVQGSHFIWKLVRRLVGVLAAIGRGDLAETQAKALLDGEGTGPTPAELTAPAAGLFLEGVYYEGDDGPGPLRPVLDIT
jgi:tRNA pseudouridine38-40 synthase